MAIVKNIQELEKAIIGRKDCEVEITEECYKKIRRLDKVRYDRLNEEITFRNIEIIVRKEKE